MQFKYLFSAIVVVALSFSACTDDDTSDPDRTPVEIDAQPFTATFQENPALGDTIGQINVSVDPVETTVTITLLDVDPAGAITFTDNGFITVNDAELFDFEGRSSITATYEASAGDVTSSAPITITLTDDPSDNQSTNTVTAAAVNITVQENLPVGEVLGQISVITDPEDLPVTFELVSSTVEGAIAISSSGEITVADAAAFDFESRSEMDFNYRASVDGAAAVGSLTIFLTDDETDNNLWAAGPITFVKDDDADHTLEENQDQITENVIITRADQGQIFNIAVESSASKENSPVGTEWAFGSISEGIETLDFQKFRDNGKPKTFENRPMVVHLLDDDIYIDITFLTWSENKNGGFSYERATR